MLHRHKIVQPKKVSRRPQAIADNLDTKRSETDALIAIKLQGTEWLKEHKKSVIYEYETGKREVSAENL
jgi:type I restriction enzyme S subunit